MDAPLYPMGSNCSDTSKGVWMLEPFRGDGVWMFNDSAAGLYREPLVGEVNDMLDRVAANIQNAHLGFRLLFSNRPFDGYQAPCSRVRADPCEGDWYRADDICQEGRHKLMAILMVERRIFRPGNVGSFKAV